MIGFTLILIGIFLVASVNILARLPMPSPVKRIIEYLRKVYWEPANKERE